MSLSQPTLASIHKILAPNPILEADVLDTAADPTIMCELGGGIGVTADLNFQGFLGRVLGQYRVALPYIAMRN